MPGKPRRQAQAARAERALKIAHLLANAFPVAECALRHTSAYELLAATILSAQCTDERVNMVTPRLFATYPDPAALAIARQKDIEEIVRSTGFFRAKAGNLIGMAQGVVERFGGEIPQSLEELITLPGVGRKTANVLLGTWHGLPAGVVVDTHVKRLTTLLGLTRAKTAEQIEADLMKLLPSTEWIQFSHRLIHHGRATCIARRPQCGSCLLRPECDRVGLPALSEDSASLSAKQDVAKARPD